MKNYDNIYIAGDILEGFWNRIYTNCYLQAAIISHNIKISEFKMKNIKKVNYSPEEKLAYLHSYNKIMIAKNHDVKTFKLSMFKNYVYRKSLLEPECYVSKKFYFKKMLDFKMNFKLK